MDSPDSSLYRPKQPMRTYVEPFAQFMHRVTSREQKPERNEVLGSGHIRLLFAEMVSDEFDLTGLQESRLSIMAITSSYTEAEFVSGFTRQVLGSTKNNIIQKIKRTENNRTIIGAILLDSISISGELPADSPRADDLIRQEMKRIFPERGDKSPVVAARLFKFLSGQEEYMPSVPMERTAGKIRQQIRGLTQDIRRGALIVNQEEVIGLRVVSALLGSRRSGQPPRSYLDIARGLRARGLAFSAEDIKRHVLNGLKLIE